ncbi:MAG TPA: hypothetical protein PK778_08165 [Bacillota bacterium]|nr:hypothetical protein [Bacillota bacterium]
MKALKVFLKIVPHALLVVTGMFITFLIIDSQNSIIGMIDSDLSKDVMWLWCALSLITAVTLIYMQRKQAKKEMQDSGDAKPNPGGEALRYEGDIGRLERDLELLLEALRELRSR